MPAPNTAPHRAHWLLVEGTGGAGTAGRRLAKYVSEERRRPLTPYCLHHAMRDGPLAAAASPGLQVPLFTVTPFSQ